MNIYEIDRTLLEKWQAFNDMMEETGGEMDEAAMELYYSIDALEIDRNKKIEGAACIWKKDALEITGIDNEIKRLQDYKKRMQREQERLERYLTYATGGEKYQGLQAQVGWRKSEAVIVDEEKLPKKYMVKKITFAPDKTEIKKLLKDGIKVKGASLEERQNISIK